MRRTAASSVLALVIVVSTAGAAFGHASFREAEVPAQSEQTLVLRVPDERDGATTVGVEVLVPPPFEVVDCPSDADWTCEVGADDEDRTVLTWARQAGEGDAELAVDVRTPDEPGDFRWPTVQTYDTGTEIAWVQADGDRPAPVLVVTDPGAPVVEDTGDPADHAAPATTGTPVAPDESVPPTEPAETDFTPPASPTETAGPADPAASVSPAPIGEEEDGGPSIVTILVILAILAAAVGALRMTRRGPAGGQPGGATSDPYDPEA